MVRARVLVSLVHEGVDIGARLLQYPRVTETRDGVRLIRFHKLENRDAIKQINKHIRTKLKIKIKIKIKNE